MVDTGGCGHEECVMVKGRKPFDIRFSQLFLFSHLTGNKMQIHFFFYCSFSCKVFKYCWPTLAECVRYSGKVG